MQKDKRRLGTPLLIAAAMVAIALGAAFLIAPIGLTSYHAVALQGEPSQEIAQGSKLNVNTASVQQLMQLDGLGVAKAQAVQEYIAANGKFATLDGLAAVDGISQKMIENWRAVACAN